MATIVGDKALGERLIGIDDFLIFMGNGAENLTSFGVKMVL